jgi:hypothetical protein
MQVPQAYRYALDELGSDPTQQRLRDGRRRMLFLIGDSFDPTVLVPGITFSFPSSPVAAADTPQPTTTGTASSPTSLRHRVAARGYSTASANDPIDSTGCLSLSARKVELLWYARDNATFSLVDSSTISVEFSVIPSNDSYPAASVLKSLTQDEVLTIQILPSCVKGRRAPKPVSLKFLRIPPVRSNTATKTAQTALAVTQLIAAASGGGALAVSGSRSTVVLGLFTCLPEFYEPLGRMDNPFQLSVGPDKYGQFLAASMMNHLLIYGLPLLHALIGVIYSVVRKVSIWEGFVWVRFPSLSLLPLQYFAETTASSAMVTAIYAEEEWHRAVAIISLLFTLSLVIGLFVHLRRSWAAECIPGVSPFTLARLEAAKKGRHHESDPKGNGTRSRLALVVDYVGYFVDGDVKWKDADPQRKKGYCRANRLLFMDYNGSNYWFMSVEVGVAALMGLLEGVKLGLGTCNAVVIVIIVVLIVFLLIIVARRPYNSPFGSYFNILVTAVQVAGATFAAIALFGGGSAYQSRCELMTLVGVYLLIAKAVMDLLPKLKRLALLLYRKCCLRQKDPALHNTDLTQRLLETIHQEGQLEKEVLADHGATAVVDVGAAEADALLPEMEEDETERAWSYDWDPSDFATLDLPQRRADDESDGTFLLARFRPKESNREVSAKELEAKFAARSAPPAPTDARASEVTAAAGTSNGGDLEAILQELDDLPLPDSTIPSETSETDGPVTVQSIGAEKSDASLTAKTAGLQSQKSVAESQPPPKLSCGDSALDALLDELDAETHTGKKRKHKTKVGPSAANGSRTLPSTKVADGDATGPDPCREADPGPSPPEDPTLTERGKSALAALGALGRVVNEGPGFRHEDSFTLAATGVSSRPGSGTLVTSNGPVSPASQRTGSFISGAAGTNRVELSAEFSAMLDELELLDDGQGIESSDKEELEESADETSSSSSDSHSRTSEAQEDRLQVLRRQNSDLDLALEAASDHLTIAIPPAPHESQQAATANPDVNMDFDVL